MKNQIDQLIESAREVRLSDGVAKHMRERLIAHMREHPVSVRPIQSPYQRFFDVLSPLTSLRMPGIAIIGILLVTLGGATTFAATGALPGDPLYPLKVNVIEPVKGLHAVSPEEKARWQVSLIETRVQEVEQLALKERLTQGEGKKSRERFDRHAQAAEASIKILSQKDPRIASEIETSFTESLTKHEKGLKKFAAQASSTSRTEAHSFADHIRAETSDIQEAASTTPLDISPTESKRNTKTEQNRNSEENRQ